MEGFCPGGFVQGILSWGFCPGGLSGPGFVRGDFVLEPPTYDNTLTNLIGVTIVSIYTIFSRIRARGGLDLSPPDNF